jgi:hypothetical protein
VRIGPEPLARDEKQHKRSARHPSAPLTEGTGAKARRDSSRTRPVAAPHVPRAAQHGPTPPAKRKAYAPSPAQP